MDDGKKAKQEDPRIERRNKIESEIGYFVGTEKWYRLHPNVLCTDGIKFVLDTAQSYWLADVVFSIQIKPEVKAELFQFYELTVDLEKSTGKLKVTDGNDKVIYEQFFPYTDFPLSTFKFYFTDNVMLLPSEY